MKLLGRRRWARLRRRRRCPVPRCRGRLKVETRETGVGVTRRTVLGRVRVTTEPLLQREWVCTEKPQQHRFPG